MAFDGVAWPVDYRTEFETRISRLRFLRTNTIGAKEYYRTRPVEFIAHWGMTYDPRKPDLRYMPFVPFKRQVELILFLQACYEGKVDGLIEKCRDAGATWIAVGFSVWLWLFHPGSAVGWGSRKQELVDQLGVPDSILEKVRIFITRLPREFWPKGFVPKRHMTFMRIINPENEATITGEVGDGIGRGGRKSIYLKDESSWYEHAELIEASLGDNTDCQIDISSVSGPNTVFYRKRRSGREWQPGAELARDRVNVFVFDVFDHPGKTKQWFDDREAKARSAGLYHIFAQEVLRDYFSAIQGAVIPAEWVRSAIDAHIKLGLHMGLAHAALDVADEGLDTNALTIRRGVVLTWADEWGGIDTGETTRKTIGYIRDYTPLRLEYDCIGVGSGVKAEYNRLKADADAGMFQFPHIEFAPWDAAAAVRDPEGPVEPGAVLTDGMPTNQDTFENYKAQGWWMLRRRFEKTHRMLTEPGVIFPPDELISLDSNLPHLHTIIAEICQPIMKQSSALRMVINKKPDGTKSPNFGDSVMMNYWPANLDFDPDVYLKAYTS